MFPRFSFHSRLTALGTALLCIVGTWVAQAGTFRLPESVTPEGRYSIGNPNAPVVVSEYADFQCPGCEYFATNLKSRFLRRELEAGQVRFEFADFPLPFHRNARAAAIAARCAGQAGAFWAYHDGLYAQQGIWAHSPEPRRDFLNLALKLKVPKAAFLTCLDSPVQKAAIEASLQRGKALQMTGTPTFSVNGRRVDWGDEPTIDSIVQNVQLAVSKQLRQK